MRRNPTPAGTRIIRPQLLRPAIDYLVPRRLDAEGLQLIEPSHRMSRAIPEDRSRRPSRLTVKYDRGHLQRWLEMEQWVDAQVQELFQGQEESSEPEIDLEALMDLSTEDQRTQLEAILQDCPGNREPFISELLSQLKRLRRLSRPSK